MRNLKSKNPTWTSRNQQGQNAQVHGRNEGPSAPGFRQPNRLPLPATKAWLYVLAVLAAFWGGMGPCWANCGGGCTSTPTNTPTKTPNVISTSTATPSDTATTAPTDSRTPTSTVTSTATETATKTTTNYAVESYTPTFTFTPTPSPTNTFTYTVTPTFTWTSTPTGTPTSTCVPPTGANSTNFVGNEKCYPVSLGYWEQLSAQSVFGMSLSDVKNLADYEGSASTTLFIPSDWKLSYFDGSVTYGPSQPYPYTQLGAESQKQGAFGILVVNGNLYLGDESGSTPGSAWNGIVFVTGNLYVGGGCLISGTVIMGYPYYNGSPGNVTLNGSGSNFGMILYNPAIISLAQLRVGAYRQDVSETKNLLGISYF